MIKRIVIVAIVVLVVAFVLLFGVPFFYMVTQGGHP